VARAVKLAEAHRNARVPSLRDDRPDTPKEVDAIIRRMMAKNPADRYQEPAEVVEALAPLADGLELREFAGLLAEQRKTEPQLPAAHKTEKYPSRAKGWRWWHVALTSLAVGLLAILGTVLLLPLIDSDPSVPRPVAPSGTPEPKEPVDHQLENRKRIASEICTLPGLDGGWWFDEMPWLVPFVRETIGSRIVDPQDDNDEFYIGSLDTNPACNHNTPEAKRWLKDLAEAGIADYPESQSTLVAVLMKISESDIDGQQLAKILAEALDGFDQGSETKTPSAVDLHTRAVLEHKLAQLENAPNRVEQARQHYDEALQAYAGGDQLPLKRLCLLDLGWLYARELDDYQTMMAYFDEAMSGDLPPFIEAHARTMKGMAAYIKDRYAVGDAELKTALDILENKTRLDSSHPYIAHAHERSAWSLIYQWKVQEAEKHFKDAWMIRGRPKNDDLAAVYALHNRHGLAMAERYLGKVEAAKRDYDAVLDDVRTLIRQQSDVSSPWLKRKLQERLYNSSERRADCELYGGAASKPATVDLENACKLYKIARDEAPEKISQAAMSLKLAIATALNASGDVDEAVKELAVANDLLSRISIEQDKKRVQLLQRVADAVVTLKTVDAPAGQQRLRDILRDLYRLMDSDSEKKERDRCEVRELYLFCVELLLASALEDQKAAADESDINYLNLLLQSFFKKEDKGEKVALCPYLRRYHEIAIEAAGKDRPKIAFDYVASSRQWQPGDATSVVFYFQHDYVREPNNLVIVQSPSHNGDCNVFDLNPLGYSRQQVLDPSSDFRFPLPEELLERITEERNAGHEIGISWSDEKCWASDEQAIRDEHWRFTELTLTE
jgi:tetratricopeptide (TPR) repeat protein